MRTPRDPERFALVVQDMDAKLVQITAAVSDLEGGATELAAIARSLNAVKPLASSEQERRSYDRFPAARLRDMSKGRFRFEGFEANPDVLRSRSQAVARRVAAARLCVEALKQGRTVPRRECSELFAAPQLVGWDSTGQFRYEVGAGYEVRRARLTGSSVEKQERLLLADQIEVCGAADRAGYRWAYRGLERSTREGG